MKVSIITVAYNSDKTIEETLKSVANQTHSEIEHIIIDGKSTDQTLEIIKKYPHISKLVSEPDNGIYDAMQKGVKLATGDVIGVINSDDIFPTHTIIEEIAETFNVNPKIDIIYGNIKYFKNDDPNDITRHMTSVPYYDTYFEEGEVPPHESFYARKKVYDTTGEYDNSFKIVGDYDFMFRALKLHGFSSLFLKKTIVLMRVGGVSSSGLRSYVTTARELFRVWEKNGFKYPPSLFFYRLYKKIYQLIDKN